MHHVYMVKRKRAQERVSKFRPTFIRQWREHRGLTLEQLASRIESTHATLSRVERGLNPYNQAMLEAIADALQTDPASLLMRDPTAPDPIWSIWERAKPGERTEIVAIADALIRAKTGT